MPVAPITTATAAVTQIAGAIRDAAQAVGSSFSYLLATAKVESNLNPSAKANTSSAQGLFQFIEQTWLATMKGAAPKLGLSVYADAITRMPNGRMEVQDPAMRKEILALRRNPQINAAMAGEFTNKNANYLTSRLGRRPTDGELYIAHFLGPGGAEKLIIAAAGSNRPGASLFPAAASANRSVFYDKGGRVRSASEVYANLVNRFENGRAGTTAMANAVAPKATPARPMLTATADPASTTQVYAAHQPVARPLDESGPVFHALFHSSERHAAVAPRINQLWSAPTAPAQARVAAAPSTAAQTIGRPLDLFQDMPPDISGLFRGRG